MLIKEQRENFAQKERERVLIIIKVYLFILANNNQFGNSKVPLVKVVNAFSWTNNKQYIWYIIY